MVESITSTTRKSNIEQGKSNTMNQLFLSLLFVCCSIEFSNAQDNADSKVADSIKSGITTFFVSRRILDQRVTNGSLDYIYATEIYSRKSLGDDVNGIYRIGVFQSHSPEHILIKQGKAYKIVDLNDVWNLNFLKEVLLFGENNNVRFQVMIEYIYKVIEIYNYNHRQNIVPK